jgi:hypothetical protein
MNAFIKTANGLAVVVNGKPYNVAKQNLSLYQAVEGLIRSNDWDAIPDTIDRALGLAKKVAAQVSDGSITIRDRRVYLTDENGVEHRLQGYEINKLLELADSGFDISPISEFAKRVRRNPSETVRARLYEFMEYGQLPLTPRGTFITYKVVRGDYLDKHSGTFDNSVGQVVSMPREQVDDNDNRTCSTGLHVCSKDYIRSFRSGNDRLMVCEVAPEDVVSIPTDYNNTKMRTAKYTVIGEITAADDPEFFGNAVYRPEIVEPFEAGTVTTTKISVSALKRDSKGRFAKKQKRDATGRFA